MADDGVQTRVEDAPAIHELYHRVQMVHELVQAAGRSAEKQVSFGHIIDLGIFHRYPQLKRADHKARMAIAAYLDEIVAHMSYDIKGVRWTGDFIQKILMAYAREQEDVNSFVVKKTSRGGASYLHVTEIDGERVEASNPHRELLEKRLNENLDDVNDLPDGKFYMLLNGDDWSIDDDD